MAIKHKAAVHMATTIKISKNNIITVNKNIENDMIMVTVCAPISQTKETKSQ
jgi:hypothetical protein